MCVVVDKENKVPKSTRTGRETRETVAPPRPQHHIYTVFHFFVTGDLLSCISIHLEDSAGVPSVDTSCCTHVT